MAHSLENAFFKAEKRAFVVQLPKFLDDGGTVRRAEYVETMRLVLVYNWT